jgi:hypothetical protein
MQAGPRQSATSASLPADLARPVVRVRIQGVDYAGLDSRRAGPNRTLLNHALHARPYSAACACAISSDRQSSASDSIGEKSRCAIHSGRLNRVMWFCTEQ